MNSKQYKQVMQQIQMPASCEQSILNQIHAPSQPKTVHHSKRHGWIAAAAAACIAITSVVTVSAARDSNWFGLFFQGQTDHSMQEAAATQTGSVTAWSGKLDDMHVELLDAYADASTFYYAIRVTPQTKNPEKYNDTFTLTPSLPKEQKPAVYDAEKGQYTYFIKEALLIDGKGLYTDGLLTTGQSHTQFDKESGSYLYIEKEHIDTDRIQLHTDSQIDISLSGSNQQKNYGELGTLSFTVNLEHAASSRTQTVSASWKKESASFQITNISITPLTLTMDGTTNSTALETASITVLLKDGSSVTSEKWSADYQSGLTDDSHLLDTPCKASVTRLLNLPVDPAEISAIQVDSLTIPFDN